MGKAPTLPGFERERSPKGRNSRALDRLARDLRDAGDYDAHAQALMTTARTIAASLDRMEHDYGASEHTIGANARVLLAIMEQLRPRDRSEANELDAFRAAIREAANVAAVRHA